MGGVDIIALLSGITALAKVLIPLFTGGSLLYGENIVGKQIAPILVEKTQRQCAEIDSPGFYPFNVKGQVFCQDGKGMVEFVIRERYEALKIDNGT